ncbi:rCG35933 [Rattus norvegicus]|uniref:RCG35933 n=1 Tax=Rattus norvegicus TaxID=10116 RepID=A6IKB2_RAT|nr:rCG35933 [Rattus norvegicus]
MCVCTPVNHIIHSGAGSELQYGFQSRLGIRETVSQKNGRKGLPSLLLKKKKS